MNIRILFYSFTLSVLLMAPSFAQDAEGALYNTVKTKANEIAGQVSENLELDISVVLDTFYYHEDTDEGMAHLKEEVSGFGHSHGAGGHDHNHASVENGFNLRHVELGLSAAVDPYFRAYTTLAVDDGSTEIEEAVIETTSLPYGVTIAAGKFFSGIGRINSQHSHNWDFVDTPLVYELLLGAHGLQNKGLQLTWLAPSDFYLLFGAEVANSDNAKCMSEVEADELPAHDQPQLFTAFVKVAPNMPQNHALRLGLSYANGLHQEAHDGNLDGTNDHWLDGRTSLMGADFVYKYDSQASHGRGDFILQAEYLLRRKELEIEQHDLMPAFAGLDRTDTQDGYYVQALYGFFERLRAGLRFEQVGLTNESELDGVFDNNFDASSRASLMLDFKPTEFSLLRIQGSKSELETEEGTEDAWEIMAQLQITFGKHAAHSF